VLFGDAILTSDREAAELAGRGCALLSASLGDVFSLAGGRENRLCLLDALLITSGDEKRRLGRVAASSLLMLLMLALPEMLRSIMQVASSRPLICTCDVDVRKWGAAS
jgi:hypothetical protein